MKEIITIGVYGLTEDQFFKNLIDNEIHVFCDIRLRRGMRGSKYKFVNSNYLQSKLKLLGIDYLHIKELAPSKALREEQKKIDIKNNVMKSKRKELSDFFVNRFNIDCLENFDINTFLILLGDNADKVAFFCVESNPKACHRSLVAKWISEKLQIPYRDVM